MEDDKNEYNLAQLITLCYVASIRSWPDNRDEPIKCRRLYDYLFESLEKEAPDWWEIQSLLEQLENDGLIAVRWVSPIPSSEVSITTKGLTFLVNLLKDTEKATDLIRRAQRTAAKRSPNILFRFEDDEVWIRRIQMYAEEMKAQNEKKNFKTQEDQLQND